LDLSSARWRCGSLQCFGYDAGKPVRQDLADDLLKSVSKLEFQLRRHGHFFSYRSDGRPTPDVNWDEVQRRVRQLGDEFVVNVPLPARQRLLCRRTQRPMKQRIVTENGRPVARFRPRRLNPDSDAFALVQAMRQVRNNLFHGGKEDCEEDPYAEDEDWVYAATQVALALQSALESGALNARA
jgi:hypothetical protein